jgi:hypothetical protein
VTLSLSWSSNDDCKASIIPAEDGVRRQTVDTSQRDREGKNNVMEKDTEAMLRSQPSRGSPSEKIWKPKLDSNASSEERHTRDLPTLLTLLSSFGRCMSVPTPASFHPLPPPPNLPLPLPLPRPAPPNLTSPLPLLPLPSPLIASSLDRSLSLSLSLCGFPVWFSQVGSRITFVHTHRRSKSLVSAREWGRGGEGRGGDQPRKELGD